MKSKALIYVKRVLLALSATLLALLVCEVALRIVGFEYRPLVITIDGAGEEACEGEEDEEAEEEAGAAFSDWRLYHAFEDDFFRYDPRLLWRPKPYVADFNEQGLRGPPLKAQKPAGEYRIFALGDSNTLGWNRDEADKEKRGANWPEFLQQRLNQPDGRFVVINAGVYGYSSWQGLRRFEELLAFEPDMVLISFGSNDAQRGTVCDAEFADSYFPPLLLKTRLGQLALTVRDRLAAGREVSAEDLVPRVSVEQYRENLRQIIEIGRERDIQCVLLTRPFTGESETETWWKNFAPQYVEATKALGAAQSVPVVDVYEHFRDRPECFADECHFTRQGHELAAELIFEGIRPLVP